MSETNFSSNASFLRRAGALALDIAAIYVIEFFVSLSGFAIGSTPAAVWNVTQWPMTGIYFVGFWSTGRTPGMMAMKLRVEAAGGVAPDLVSSLIRFVVLGGAVALAGATLIALLLPYAIACAFGFYPHDLVARTVVRRVSREGLTTVSETRSYAVGRAINWLVFGFFGLMLVGLTIGLAGGGMGDVGYTAYVRNDSGLDVQLTHAFNGSSSFVEDGLVQPGAVTDVGKVGGPRETPTLVIKAHDMGGVLVFCRALTYSEYKDSARSAPIPMEQGDLRCG